MKKILAAVFAAFLTLSVFTACTYEGNYASKDLPSAEVDLSTAKVGYGLEIVMDGDKAKADPLTITASGYSQAQVKLPYTGFKKATIKVVKITGKTTIGFLPAGANPWDGRIAGADKYQDTPVKDDEIVVDIPEGAAFITFGSNGADSKIVIEGITISAE
ncbi:MAG: hypothetical protein MJ188_09565 [Treponema sp.]|nr:hypothetical protein [Treponema sp.]